MVTVDLLGFILSSVVFDELQVRDKSMDVVIVNVIIRIIVNFYRVL